MTRTARKFNGSNKFLNDFLNVLDDEVVVDPAGLVKPGDISQLCVRTDTLTSSEAEAVVKAMVATMATPIRVSGEVFRENGSIISIAATFSSATGRRKVTLQEWVHHIGNEVLFDGRFVTEALGPKATQEQEDFIDFVSIYVR